MTTYRERRQERAERLREWADKRQRRAVEQLNSQPELRHDWAFITQPGHIPERARMNRADERSFRSMEKAESMSSRADEIERQADAAIYSDDPDAIERLREKLARLEAERQRWTDYNKAAKKSRALVFAVGERPAWDSKPDIGAIPADVLAILDDEQRREVALLAAHSPYNLGPNGQVAAYVTSNLSGNIKRTRDRLAVLERPPEQERGRYLIARYGGTCRACGEAFEKGAAVVYFRASKECAHYPTCEGTEAA